MKSGGRSFPLKPDKVEAHRAFPASSKNDWLTPFHITRFTKWLQDTPEGPFIVIYTEHDQIMDKEELKRAAENPSWQEAALTLSDHSGLSKEALIPEIEWLTPR